jgi:energy-coupling factor transporter ATP-binding protein EcfA2
MKILSLKTSNYRTLESLEIAFSPTYAAICGPNDSGKTNVVRVIRTFVKEGSRGPVIVLDDDDELSTKDEYTKWKDIERGQREIVVSLCLSFHSVRDVGFYQFVLKQLALKSEPETLELTIECTYRADKPTPIVRVLALGENYEDLNAQQVLQKLQATRGVLFHNSTSTSNPYLYPGRSVAGLIRELTVQHEAVLSSMKQTVNRGLSKISKAEQAGFEALLGRLKTKYKVGLSVPSFEFDYLPLNMTLGERKFAVPLDDWGSGTKNRTLILLALFRARQIADAEPSATKITPVTIIEEPESFLHPSAQAEFGRVLQDLAEEFGVQVIVTTHSPYLLNLRSPGSNVLLRRRTAYNQLRDTERVDTTGENWMAPFGQALGLDAEEFRPWKTLILGNGDAILLVEGDTDKEYFEMLRDEAHGQNRLSLQGEIVSYEGTGALSNSILLRFVKNRHQKLFVTFDLDSIAKIEKTLHVLELEKARHYWPIGANVAGKRNIEGLLPDSIITAVISANPGVVQAIAAGTKEEQESNRNRLKKLLLAEFKAKASPTQEFFGQFYQVVKVINKALAS